MRNNFLQPYKFKLGDESSWLSSMQFLILSVLNTKRQLLASMNKAYVVIVGDLDSYVGEKADGCRCLGGKRFLNRNLILTNAWFIKRFSHLSTFYIGNSKTQKNYISIGRWHFLIITDCIALQHRLLIAVSESIHQSATNGDFARSLCKTSGSKNPANDYRSLFFEWPIIKTICMDLSKTSTNAHGTTKSGKARRKKVLLGRARHHLTGNKAHRSNMEKERPWKDIFPLKAIRIGCNALIPARHSNFEACLTLGDYKLSWFFHCLLLIFPFLVHSQYTAQSCYVWIPYRTQQHPSCLQ